MMMRETPSRSPRPRSVTRADLHCHSTASEISKLGIQRAAGLPECATPPSEVYELAKRRGMDFVTITDHDTIDGCLEIADRPDVFVSEELTAWFRGEPQAVHVLCWGIDRGDHEWLQAHAADVETVAAYLAENRIACALAHPFYAVEAPLTPSHRRRLSELFPIWETRNGARAPELNGPAVVYIETRGGTGVGGSDDHAGVDVGRTWTEAPPAETPAQYLEHIRAGRVEPHGKQGSAAKWAHSALVLAARTHGVDSAEAPDPFAVLRMAERVMVEGDARASSAGGDIGPEDARRLLRAWLSSMGLDLDLRGLIAFFQSEGHSHSDLERRARRAHERKLARAVERIADMGTGAELASTAAAVWEACTPVIPYMPARAFLGREREKLSGRDADAVRVALVADGVGGMHGVTHTLDEIRERGIPGYEVEVVGTDPQVDRRLTTVAELDIPFYPGLQIGVPSLHAVAETMADGRYDLVHLCSPGPSGLAAAIMARLIGLPVVGSYHTELQSYARLRTNDVQIEMVARMALAAFYGQCAVVLSPSDSADRSLTDLGIPVDRLGRWDRGVDLDRFSPTLRETDLLPGETTILYAGRLTEEKGLPLLVDAFLRARQEDPGLHLCLAGGGPEQELVRERLGDAATFLGWLEGDELARAYASADVFLFASQTDTFGQAILEAQASGLPVLAVAEGGPAELVQHGRTGLLASADADALARELLGLVRRPALRAALAAQGREAVRERSWDQALGQLGHGYERALLGTAGAAARAAA
jgi:glycosyltransferase involved in cell wall biosynthesis/predicted metal-dependent phosphoesterase TrpH